MQYRYQLPDGTVIKPAKPEQMRWRLIGTYIKSTGVERRFEKIAEIAQRTLASVGGIREDRKYGRRKARKWGVTQRTVTPMMLVAVANEIAARRARNKSAAVSRRINRRHA